jgi:hypothetical protein
MYDFIIQINNHFHVPWCSRPKIHQIYRLFVFSEEMSDPSRLKNNLPKIVKNLQSKFHPTLRYIRLKHPTMLDHGYIKGGMCFALIEIGTDKADFQFYFDIVAISQALNL